MTPAARRNPLKTLVRRDYALVLSAALLLAGLVFLADRRANEATSIRSANTAAAQKRERLTEEILRDAFAVRAPAALQAGISNARQMAILGEGSRVDPADFQTLLEVSLIDSSVVGLEGPIAQPIAQRGFDITRYIDDTNQDVRATLAATGTQSPAAAGDDDTAALQLRLLAVLPALAIFLAGLIKYSKGRVRASLLPIGWSLVLVCVCFFLVVEL